ncbi:MAG: hypothetical protein ACI8W8_004291 [Rhodothermales bacterium]|jgi:uncharacterized protein YqfA (UPF0365 family)
MKRSRVLWLCALVAFLFVFSPAAAQEEAPTDAPGGAEYQGTGTFVARALVILAVAGAVLVILGVLVVGQYVPLYIQARASKVPISLLAMVGMRLRKVSPQFIVEEAIQLWKSGMKVSPEDMETHVLSGGSLGAVVEAAISVSRSGLDYSFAQIAAMDLAGRDVVAAVRAVVQPEVLHCPAAPGQKIRGVSRDGVRLSVKLRVTIKTNLDRLIGGAGKETILARLGEGTVAAIGTADSYKVILDRPELITQHILNRGLDAGTAYEIVSVDVADIDVQDNIGARLMEEQARADQLAAQARAEIRRADAVAREQEMKARIVDMQAQVTLSEADVPQALAGAARGGRIWRSPNPVTSTFGSRHWDVLDV